MSGFVVCAPNASGDGRYFARYPAGDAPPRLLPLSGSTTLPNASTGGSYFYRPQVIGGHPPYYFSLGSVTGVNSYYVTRNGTLYSATATADTASLPVTVQDSAGIVATTTYGLTTDSTLRMMGVSQERSTAQPLASGNVSTKYRLQLQGAAGGSGTGYAYAVSSGSLPAGLSMSAAGLITGTPTAQGTSTFTVQATDSANNTATAQFSISINALSQSSRPSYNTGAGFFVDPSGILRDPGGYEFRVRGLDRNHYDVSCQPGMALAAPNTCRFFIFSTNGSIPASTYASTAQNDHIAHNEVPIVTMSYFPNGNGTTGDSSTSDLALGLGWWYANASAFSTQMPRMMANIANEWGPSASATWQYAYQAVGTGAGASFAGIPISGISGTTITVNSAAATNPFANCPLAVIKGAGGVADQVVNLSSPGGVSGAWTVTSSVSLSGYTGGGQLVGGAIGIMRAAGFTCPLVIDSGGAGQDETNFENYAASVLASDPQQNCVFSYHMYGAGNDASAPISGISQAGSAVVTLNYPYSSPNTHPFGGSYTGISPNNNTWNGQNYYVISGVQGMTQANGIQACAQNNLGGVQGSSPWTVTLLENSTVWGNYTGGGQVVEFSHYSQIIQRLAALRASGVCVILGEFGPGRNIGASPTLVTPEDLISACEANNMGWIYWAWDDNNGSGGATSNNWFGCQKQNGTYGSPSDLTEQGLDVVLSPNTGLTNLATPAPVFL